MKHVVITGSSRGLGLWMARSFLDSGCSVTISGRNPANLARAEQDLASYGNCSAVLCDVRESAQLDNLWQSASRRWGRVDYWINNAGIAQLHQPLWELSDKELDEVLGINLLGTMRCCRTAMRGMLQQGYGQIFNMEGFGSNGMIRPGMSLYGTSKRAVAYYTRALAREAKDSGVLVGSLSPGMMVTDFVKKPRDGASEIDPQTRRIFNILGDKPETVARFLVHRILSNQRNGVRFEWLSRSKMIWRFTTAIFTKRELFD